MCVLSTHNGLVLIKQSGSVRMGLRESGSHHCQKEQHTFINLSLITFGHSCPIKYSHAPLCYHVLSFWLGSPAHWEIEWATSIDLYGKVIVLGNPIQIMLRQHFLTLWDRQAGHFKG